MAIAVPVAGAYTSAWGGQQLGYTRQGFNLNYTIKGERVEETDVYGLSLIEMIYRGAQLTMDFICKIYQSSTVGVLQAWTPTNLVNFGQTYAAANPIAQLGSFAGQAMVLTATPNTPAATNPTSLTAARTLPAFDNNFQIIFNSVLREVPIRLDVLTVDNSGTGSVFSLS